MLLAEQLKKLGEDVLPIPRSAPDDAGLVVVDDHRHIFVAFLVAGLVNADIDQPVETGQAAFLHLLVHTLADAAYRMPFHPHKLRDSAAGGMYAKPCSRLLKALRACLKSIKTPSRHIFFRWAALT